MTALSFTTLLISFIAFHGHPVYTALSGGLNFHVSGLLATACDHA